MIAPARILGLAVAAAAALGLTAASRMPMRVHPAPDAMLRVAFSARPERVETCRTLSAEELAERPAHMRQSVECEGTTARYRLDVLLHDTLALSTELRGGGLRRDRRLFVLRELSVPSGPLTVEVRLARLDTVPDDDDVDDDVDDVDDVDDDDMEDDDAIAAASRDEEERRRRRADEVPASLVLREMVTLAPREVLLVTYDQQARRLHAVREAP